MDKGKIMDFVFYGEFSTTVRKKGIEETARFAKEKGFSGVEFLESSAQGATFTVQDIPSAKKTAEIPFREFSHGGFTILVGRNNLQNDRLLRTASPNDIWLHTQKYHSSHVLIVTDGRAVPDEVIKFAAEVCAYYSDGRAGDKIPVDYCEKRFVKKPSKSNAGFVVYTDYKTALATPNAHTESLTK